MAQADSFQLLVQNNSFNTGAACVYQQDPKLGVPGVQTLAWLVQPMAAGTKYLFQWTNVPCFVWAATGSLRPGTVFFANQTLDADLSTTNMVTFTQQGGAYSFTNPRAGPESGSLFIRTDGSIAFNAAAVGIGSDGRGSFAVQAQPNVTYQLTPNPTYWVSFGTFQAGEVLDVKVLQSKTALAGMYLPSSQIVFPPNVNAMTATLNPDNSWSLTQGIS
jgi:hypothetical protein